MLVRINLFLLLFYSFTLISVAQGNIKILVFSKTSVYRHASIEKGIEAIDNFKDQYNFEPSFTEDANAFTPENLESFAVVVFLNTTGDVLNNSQQEAFEEFIRAGKGFVGIHSATDTEYDWPFYGEMIGRYFKNHPHIQSASVLIEKDHASTSHLPEEWTRTDEWYNFKPSLSPDLEVLLSVDESTYSGGEMGDKHPVSWINEYEGGRIFYTAMGHTEESYTEENFLKHIAEGILWASGKEVTSIEDPVFAEPVKVFPNPVQNFLFIHSPSPIIRLSICTKDGKEIENYPVQTKKIDVGSYSPGNYFLLMEYPFKRIIIKFIKN